MLKALKTVIQEVRTNDQRSLALELALKQDDGLDQLVRTIGVGPTLLLVKAFAGRTLKVPQVAVLSQLIEDAAAAVEAGKAHPITLRKRYPADTLRRASKLRKQLDEVEAARQVLIQKMNSLSTD